MNQEDIVSCLNNVNNLCEKYKITNNLTIDSISSVNILVMSTDDMELLNLAWTTLRSIIDSLEATLATVSDNTSNLALASLRIIRGFSMKVYSDCILEFCQLIMRNDPQRYDHDNNLTICRDILFKNCGNEIEIDERLKKWKSYIHPDKFVRFPNLISASTSTFQIVSTISLELKKYISNVYGNIDEKIISEIELGDAFNRLASEYNAIIKYRENIRSENYVNILNKLRIRLNVASINDLFPLISNDELMNMRKVHAWEAIRHFRLVIRFYDSQRTNHEKRILYRKRIAKSYHYAGLIVEAQLNILGAMYIVTDYYNRDVIDNEIKDLEKMMNDLQRLSTSKITKTSNANSPNPASNKSNSTVVVEIKKTNSDLLPEGSYRNRIRDEIRSNYSVWIAEYSIRPNNDIVSYRSNSEIILASKSQSRLLETSGKILKYGGGAVTAVTSVGAVAEIGSFILTLGQASILGPMGWGVLIAAAGISFAGYFIYEKGSRMSEDVKIRESLSTIIEKAAEKYKHGEPVLEELSTSYYNNDKYKLIQLYKDRDGKYIGITINPDSIIENLKRYDFRSDGIAFVLNMIADSLLSRNFLNLLSPNGDTNPDSLRVKAKELYITIRENHLDSNRNILTNDAKIMDNKIYKSRSGIGASFINSISQNLLRIVEKIPDEYINDFAEAPVTARLKEIQNIARVNILVLTTLEKGHKDSAQNIQTQFTELQKILNNEYSYFGAISADRLEAIVDFLASRDILLQVNLPSTDYQDILIEDKSQFMIKWGASKLQCVDVTYIDRNSLFSLDLLKFSLELFEIEGLQGLSNRIDESNQIKVIIDKDNSYWDTSPNAKDLIDLICSQSSTAQEVLSPLYLKELGRAIYSSFIFCKVNTNGESYTYEVIGNEVDIDTCVFFGYTLDQSTGLINSLFRIININEMGDTQLMPPYLHRLYDIGISSLNEARTDKSSMKWYDSREKLLNFLKNCHPSWLILFTCYKLDLVQYFRDIEYKSSNILKNFIRKYYVEEIIAVNGILESLAALGKFDHILRLVVHLRTDQFMSNCEFLFWYAYAARHCVFYIDSAYALAKAFELEPNNKKVNKEKKILDKLRSDPVKAPVNNHVKTKFVYEVNYRKTSPSKDYFDVLSIDGGGIRGIYPAFILSELEKRTRIPLYKLFDLNVGTSTGGVVAAGITMPCVSNTKNPGEPLPAYKLLHLYTNPDNINKIFKPNRISLNGIIGSKYQNSRETVFKEVIGDLPIGNAKSNLILVAAHRNSQVVYPIYSMLDNIPNPYNIIDGLMATSAAPTFFPPFGDLVDGGVVANNPSGIAYAHANSISNGKDIRIWSLGTGDYRGDPTSRISQRLGWFAGYWLLSAFEASFHAQSDQVHSFLHSALGHNYRRWNILFEDFEPMDNCNESVLISHVERARQFVEENTDDIDTSAELLLRKIGIDYR